MEARVMIGLHIGDALGATSEYQEPSTVPALLNKYKPWPEKFAGNEQMWRPGQPTDDTNMAMCIWKAIKQSKLAFNYETMTNLYIEWMNSNPPDIGGTTKKALTMAQELKEKQEHFWWYKGSKDLYLLNPNNRANGSLMRNGIVGAATAHLSLFDAFEYSILQGIGTHYGPFCVLTCVMHTWLIRNAVLSKSQQAPVTIEQVSQVIANEWQQYKKQCTNVIVLEWLQTIGTEKLHQAEQELVQDLQNFEQFDPYVFDMKELQGSCVLALKIALWALYWSFQSKPYPVPSYFPAHLFDKRNFETVYWVVLIGADADSYGAITGSLLAAYWPDTIPESLAQSIELYDEIQLVQNNK